MTDTPAKPLTADEIVWVGQENPNGCVIASLAMVTGIPYREILSTYPWAVDGCDMETVAADFLYRQGIAWQRIYINQPAPRFENHHRADWPPKPWAPAHLCMVETSQNHCVVMKMDGTVLDPLTPQQKGLRDYKKTMQVWGLFNVATIEQQYEQIEKLQTEKREIENAAFERAAQELDERKWMNGPEAAKIVRALIQPPAPKN